MDENITSKTALPTVSILMLNYNGTPHLKEFFESVFRLNYPADRYDVVVIDNNSTDGSPDWIAKNYPQVKLVRLDTNTGFARGNNIGVNYCVGEYVAFVNNDTILDREWLMELVKPAINDPDAIYCGKTLSYYKRDYVVYAGAVIFAWGYPCRLGTYFKDNTGTQENVFTLFPDGCDTLVKKALYQELGGFEERYFCYGEDVELGWKAWLKGYRVYYIPAARIYHKVRGTLGRSSGLVWYLIWRNQLRNLIRFSEPANLALEIPEFMIFTAGFYVAVLCVQDKQFGVILLLMKSYFEILFELPVLIKERAAMQKDRKISDKTMKKLRLILPLKDSIQESFASLKRRKEYCTD